MSLKFEQKWKTSLISILEELSNSEYKKMLLNLDKIPKRLKSGRSREEMPQIITQYYGVEQSVLAIKKVMDLIPRKDAAVQDRLQPFVDKLKKKGQTKNKDKKESGKPDKTKTISALKSSGQLLDSEAIVGKVVHKSDVHTDVNKDNETESFFNLVVADKTGSIKVMVYGTERFKDIKEKSCYMFKKVIVDENFIKVTSLTTVSKTTAIKIPAKVQREAQMIIDQEPASSKAQTSAQKMPVTVQGTVTGIGPGKPVKSKLEKIGTQSKGIKVTPKTTKMSLRILEQKWKTSLTSILEELSNSEYKKMLLNLGKIPRRLKTGRSREEMLQTIIQYYGVEQSVLEIKKVMDLIPRKDAAVQDRLQPFVDKLKKKRQTKNKDKKESGKPGEVIVDGNIIKVTRLTTVSKTTAIKIPAKVQREAQMIIDLNQASSKAQTSAQKMPVNVQGTVTGIDPGKPVISKQKKTGSQSKGIKIKDVMDLLPRRDAAVQDLLRPFVDQLKKKDETMKVEEPCGQSSKPGGNKHFVDEHRADLIQRVTNIEPILDELLGDFIQTEAYNNIRSKRTSQAKMRELYDGTLKAGEEVKDAFYKLLEKCEGRLVRDIKKKTKHT